MKLKKGKSVNHVFHAAAVVPAAVLGVGLTVSIPAAHATILQQDEIVVTARRTEEVIQNIPISMTVFNQDMLDERNVKSGADLAAFTPSLGVNTRFGGDNTTFAIRGFTQELRTTASVAVYFADVVAPRGASSTTAGDGAGPGSFFDLQNVQVLKGPQGTLFGRNTTGGAIQLVPQEPTTKLEGYLEQSAGNYNLRRTQGVINVPIADSVRARFGFDTEKRDGYLVNTSGIGPDRLANVNYFAGRGSVMWDVADAVQNYTIYSYVNSRNNGSIQGLAACDPNGATSFLCIPNLQAQGHGFYNVSNDTPDPISYVKQWQVINTTTWTVNDNFTIKNNLSAANLQQEIRFSNFGANFNSDGSAIPAGHIYLFPGGTVPGFPSAAQNTYVEELQFQGTALDTKLTWQAGLYYERSRPDGASGALSATFAQCDPATGDISNYRCSSIFPGGSVVENHTETEYINKAIYGQGTYDITDEFRMTVGLRYTDDTTNATGSNTSYTFDSTTHQVNGYNCIQYGANPTDCSYSLHQHSQAPTWLIDFDYLPTPDLMFYAKYARGYRQGSVSLLSPAGQQTFDPEKVDAYEIGTKTTFHSFVSGTFNISAFYNELSNQQLQVGEVPCGLGSGQCTALLPGQFQGPGTTAIVNAGASTIQGIEVETTLNLYEGLLFNLSYSYLATHLDSQTVPLGAPGYTALPAAVEGGHLSFSPTNTVTAALSYTLPIPADWGTASLGGSYSFVSDQISTVDVTADGVNHGVLPSRRLVNLNGGWKAIAGSPVDVTLFMTNALNEKYATYNPGVYGSLGAQFQVVGEPKMWGARVKYNFGK